MHTETDIVSGLIMYSGTGAISPRNTLSVWCADRASYPEACVSQNSPRNWAPGTVFLGRILDNSSLCAKDGRPRFLLSWRNNASYFRLGRYPFWWLL